MSESTSRTRRPARKAAAPAEERTPDLEVIVPDEIRLDVDGVPCRVKRLKTREFLALLKVLTSGLGSALGSVAIDFTDAEAVARDMSALMLLAVPNAVEEFVVFLGTIVEPVDGRHRAQVGKYLNDDPDLDVLLAVFEAVATQEKDDLAALAGKAQAMWSRLGPLYGARTQ